MHRPVAGIWDVPDSGTTWALVVTALAFFTGGLVGFALTSRIEGQAAESLTLYVETFLDAIGGGEVGFPALPGLLWQILRWPALTVVFSFTAFGVLGIPALFAVRGFLFSFSVAAFIRVMGGFGGLVGAVVFGLTGALAIPALFVLGVQGLTASRRLAGRALGDGKARVTYGKRYFFRCGLCAAAHLVCVVLEYTAVPLLAAALSGLRP